LDKPSAKQVAKKAKSDKPSVEQADNKDTSVSPRLFELMGPSPGWRFDMNNPLSGVMEARSGFLFIPRSLNSILSRHRQPFEDHVANIAALVNGYIQAAKAGKSSAHVA